MPRNMNQSHGSTERELLHRRIREGTMAREQDRSTVPPSLPVISAEGVDKWKSNLYGQVKRAQAKHIARGYFANVGVDYLKTFSPNPSPWLTRLVAAADLGHEFDLSHFDARPPFVRFNMIQQSGRRCSKAVVICRAW